VVDAPHVPEHVDLDPTKDLLGVTSVFGRRLPEEPLELLTSRAPAGRLIPERGPVVDQEVDHPVPQLSHALRIELEAAVRLPVVDRGQDATGFGEGSVSG
jgi:hypothetical protein